MPFQPAPHLKSVLASALAAAGVALIVASCSHITPLGPEQPRPHHLRFPIILQAMRTQPPTPAGRCAAGAIALPGGPGQCYRKIGTPMTITSAAVSVATLTPSQLNTSSSQAAGPPSYAFMIALPVSEAAALTKITTTASDARGYLTFSAAGRTWLLPRVLQPFTRPQFEIIPSSRSQARWLRHILVPPG